MTDKLFNFSAKEVMRLRQEHHIKRCVENLQRARGVICGETNVTRMPRTDDYYMRKLKRHLKKTNEK